MSGTANSSPDDNVMNMKDLQDDVVKEKNLEELIFRNSSLRHKNFFVVPKVLE